VLNLDKHIPFVKEQQGVNEKLAHRYETEPWRHDRHVKTATMFANLAQDLVAAQKALDAENARATTLGSGLSQRLALTPEDIEGLPDELLRELSVSDADKLEFTIVNLINEAGGILSLDRILIGVYKATKEIYKRNVMNAKLYRMAQKDMLFSVPGRKGVYSTSEIAEEEPKRVAEPTENTQLAG
jgi:hypothetical protein